MKNKTDIRIKEFQQIYKKVFNKSLSKKEAFEKSLRLLNLYKSVYVSNDKKRMS